MLVHGGGYIVVGLEDGEGGYVAVGAVGIVGADGEPLRGAFAVEHGFFGVEFDVGDGGDFAGIVEGAFLQPAEDGVVQFAAGSRSTLPGPCRPSKSSTPSWATRPRTSVKRKSTNCWAAERRVSRRQLLR